ncbi:helix-turn-helix domain-containing protein [Stackebrandtia soli]|uniref:helix-turn-helix domain-containing protein n=1 Tax=Stackebrandtia soli TaxID=1892856 RepID=UPI0039EB1F33
MGANHRLRDALARSGFSPAGLANELGVDPKTVSRWLTGRIPYPRYRTDVARLVNEFESVLWPTAISDEDAPEVARSEILRTYPHRSAVPIDLWSRTFDQARERILILAYSGLFLPETDPNLVEKLRTKARSGTEVVILMGDPDSEAVAIRGTDEGIGDALAAKIRNVLAFYRPLADEPAIHLGFHASTLYNSIYVYDDDMFVNTHVYGSPAAHAPVHHLRRLGTGQLFATYMRSFNRVRSESTRILES